jgi:plastocyanin
MKKLILLNTILLLAILGFAQNTHTLHAYDMYYSPDTLYTEVGDTIELISHGYHSATEVDSVDWANNTANHNGGFYVGLGSSPFSNKFTIDASGTYYNICVPHASMGMKSIIIVESTITDIHESKFKQDISIYPNPASSSITIQNSSTVKIYSMVGELVFEKSDLNGLDEIDISLLSKGIYNVVLDGGREKLIVK